MSLLIIDNYDSFTFNLYQMLQERTPLPVRVHRNDAISIDGVKELAPAGIVLSPGPGHPKNQRDFGVCAEIIKQAAELRCPILGVCLGHQGIAHYLGGSVERAPHIVHGKTSKVISTASSPLFASMPKSFTAMRYHSLVVSQTDLPGVLDITAHDEKTNLIMAMQHKTLPLFGLQFHPESIGTPEGGTILQNFINLC
jgi:anthranilate synthase component II